MECTPRLGHRRRVDAGDMPGTEYISDQLSKLGYVGRWRGASSEMLYLPQSRPRVYGLFLKASDLGDAEARLHKAMHIIAKARIRTPEALSDLLDRCSVHASAREPQYSVLWFPGARTGAKIMCLVPCGGCPFRAVLLRPGSVSGCFGSRGSVLVCLGFPGGPFWLSGGPSRAVLAFRGSVLVFWFSRVRDGLFCASRRAVLAFPGVATPLGRSAPCRVLAVGGIRFGFPWFFKSLFWFSSVRLGLFWFSRESVLACFGIRGVRFVLFW